MPATTERLMLHEMFARQARRTPHAEAVVDRERSLSYDQVARRTRGLAGWLRGQGVGADESVGVLMDKSADSVVALLGALEAGGAFLPLELAYPDALLAEVLADASPPVVLTQTHLASRLPEAQARLCLDEEPGPWADGGAAGDGGPDGAPSSADPERLGFVVYSSGTTGRPKGIANPHRAAVASYRWRWGVSDQRPGDRVGCNVFFIWEVLRPLLRGATSVVIPDEVIYDPVALVDFLRRWRVSETLMTPSLLEAVLNAHGAELGERLEELRVLWLNGEVVTKTLARRALAALPRTRVLNVYSISEAHEVAAGDLRELVDHPSAAHCPVGRPLDPDGLYVLDERGRRVPDGEPGELFVGGPCLARGYVKRPGLTSERFVDDPFRPGARMYRSGDRARLLPGGVLEVLGRTNFMVKIRGYSVELGAVEAAIEQSLPVRGCVVVAEGEEGQRKRLVAYVVPTPEGDGDGWRIDRATGRSPSIRRRLLQRLPHYMVPSVYVRLDALPLQPTTGKVDRQRLPPPPDRAGSGAAVDRPRTLPAEAPREDRRALLVDIWGEVLELDEGDVAVDDDFFDVGGDSLAAAELATRVDAAFGVHLPVGALLEHPTVTGMLDAVEARRGDTDHLPARDGKPDLRAEATLDPDIVPERPGPPRTLRDARHVLLTGATGFLGTFLLDALLSRTGATVHCLVRAGQADPIEAVRAGLRRHGLAGSLDATRIVPVPGDLEAPLLGLTDDAFADLARRVDLVVHVAARVNLVYPYRLLRPANVSGTREVLRLACRETATPMVHVSTNGIFPPDGRRCLEDTDLDTLVDARADGYGQSKWVAEKLVAEAAGRGLPTCVLRPGNIAGHSRSGSFNPRDFLGALLAESVRVGAAPRIEGWRLEMTPVDVVCDALLRIAGTPDPYGAVFHLAEPDPVPADTVFDWLEEMGYGLERLPYPRWVEAWRSAPLEDADGQDALGGVLRTAAPDGNELWDGNIHDDRNTRRALGAHAVRRPALDPAVLRTYMRSFARAGLIGEPSASTGRAGGG
ncbi:MAG: thioester reductase domain-containing protein [Actinobacteria bacterium]|nr:thioester reductase domain-containing protein [Actinomycetota bacterium]